jgi:NitT/TauT family transport system permease protein
VALTAVPLGALLLTWHLLTANEVVWWLRFDKIPGPAEVYSALTTQLGTGAFYNDLLVSLRRIMLGFSMAAVVGVATGAMIGRSRLASSLLRPLIEVFRPIPAIALVPLAILLFPDSEQGIVFITFFAAFFPVTGGRAGRFRTYTETGPRTRPRAAPGRGARAPPVAAGGGDCRDASGGGLKCTGPPLQTVIIVLYDRPPRRRVQILGER